MFLYPCHYQLVAWIQYFATALFAELTDTEFPSIRCFAECAPKFLSQKEHIMQRLELKTTWVFQPRFIAFFSTPSSHNIRAFLPLQYFVMCKCSLDLGLFFISHTDLCSETLEMLDWSRGCTIAHCTIGRFLLTGYTTAHCTTKKLSAMFVWFAIVTMREINQQSCYLAGNLVLLCRSISNRSCKHSCHKSRLVDPTKQITIGSGPLQCNGACSGSLDLPLLLRACTWPSGCCAARAC